MTKKLTKADFWTLDEVKRDIFARRPEVKAAYDALEPEYALIRALLEARIKQGVTQQQIAKKAGTTQSAIARFESGRSNPTLAFAVRLSKAVGMRLDIRAVPRNSNTRAKARAS
jgi:DNA-binding XRE family transcriptional regulator